MQFLQYRILCICSAGMPTASPILHIFTRNVTMECFCCVRGNEVAVLNQSTASLLPAQQTDNRTQRNQRRAANWRIHRGSCHAVQCSAEWRAARIRAPSLYMTSARQARRRFVAAWICPRAATTRTCNSSNDVHHRGLDWAF